MLLTRERNWEWYRFNRVITAGDTVIACFHHINAPADEIQVSLRRDEACRLAEEILKAKLPANVAAAVLVILDDSVGWMSDRQKEQAARAAAEAVH